MTKRKKREDENGKRKQRGKVKKVIERTSSNQRLLLRIILLALEKTLDPINDQAKSAKQVSKPETPSSHTNSVDEEVNKHPVDNDEGQENAEAAPLIALVDVEIGHVLRSSLVWAVLAVLCGGLVDQVSDLREVVNEVTCILLAS